MKKIIFFGIYDPDYSRNRVLRKGFQKNGYEIIECRVDPKIGAITKFIRLFSIARKIDRDYRKDKPLVLVAFPGQSVVWLARIVFGRNIIFDAFLSLYDSNVLDRKLYSRLSIFAIKDWLLDFASALLAKRVLIDTHEHGRYFCNTFHVNVQKMLPVPVGVDSDIFLPERDEGPAPKFSKERPMVCHFHGMYIPLQGIKYIVEAADMLKNEDIIFNLVGSGQEFAAIMKLLQEKKLQNVKITEKVPLREVPRYIKMGDVCLGIFGETEKAARVIPNKVYEYVSVRKPVITADTPAIRELFHDGEDIILARRADAADLANKILFVKNDMEFGRRVAHNAYEMFMRELLPEKIIANLLSELEGKK